MMFCLTASSWGQVVITEIMYNPPESGTDTYEYVEIFNTGNAAVNLLGYSFDGFTYEFTSEFNLGVGEYALFAVDSIAFEAAFGVTAFQFVSGGLSNGGETIALFDANGNVVDEVDYDDSFPWDASADGSGASLVLCDVSADNNDGANWDAASTGSGVLSEGVEMFANPGAASSCPDGAVVRFLETEYEFGEADGTVTISVEISGAASSTLSVDVEADMMASTVDFGSDVSVASTTLNFNTGEVVDTMDFTFSIIDDSDVESLETLVLNLTNASMDVSINTLQGSTIVAITDNDATIPDIVINEIMYNPPGDDSMFEYLELYNNGTAAVNVAGFYFTEGIEDTLHDVTIMPGGFLVLAVDSVAYADNYGGTAYQWTSGALGNGGEDIELRDAMGNVVDFVDYDDAAPWDEAADGSGSSLVLCDPSSDNSLAESWIAGVQPSGIFISGTQILGSPGSVNDCVAPEPMGYTIYNIGEVTGSDPVSGIADSLGVQAELTATVYGVNLRPGGLQFTLIDVANDGIGVFSNSNDFGYTVNEGDEVTVRGVIGQFNGLTQINVDTIFATGNTNTLVPSTDVTALDESTESQLIRITDLTVVDITPAGGLNVNMSDGTNTYLMRIDFDTDITEEFINGIDGATVINLTGIGGQFDGSEPYDEGYQILPRSQADFEFIVATTEPSWGAATLLFPNPATDYFVLQTEVEVDYLVVRNELGQIVSQIIKPNTSVQLDELTSGLYIVELYHAGERVVRKLIKQ